ncbi:hypothetical protein [Acinetobacter ursingii]|uniref:hypothetical protein n=1 Tax=Acinetobacter ursingii TaxID=108980 RepID=UPI00124F9127|nr:hypothetical protein [Acinetobacter ursingii]
MISKFSELAMGIDSVIMDVIEEWGDDLIPIIGNANIDAIDGVRHLTIVSYMTDDDQNKYALFEDGSIYRVTSITADDGVTWNGDDVYVKSYKSIWTVHEKVGSIEIEDLDYFLDENIEIVVCNFIEELRLIGS